MYPHKKKQSELEKIYDKLAANIDIKDDYDFIIKIYKESESFLSNVKSFISVADLKIFKEISFLYTNALFNKDRYNDTIDSVNFSLPIINSGIETKKAKHLKDRLLEKIQLLQGVSHYNLKDYKNSTPIFKALTKADTRNDSYKNWLRYSQYGEKSWIGDLISLIGICLFILGYVMEYIIDDFQFKSVLVLTGGPLVLATSIYQYFAKRKPEFK